MEYPSAPRGTDVETFQSSQNGSVQIPNPYKWLEDSSSYSYATFVQAQNARSESYIHTPSSSSDLQSLQQTLTKLHGLPSLASPPFSCGNHYYYRIAGQGKAFPVWYRIKQSELITGEDPSQLHEVFHDEMSEMGAVISSGFSAGGKYWAYSSSIKGSEWGRIHVRDTVTGERLGDEIVDTKFTGKPSQISWLGDVGFFYQFWPERRSGLHPQLRFHCVGEEQELDVVVFEDREEPSTTFCVRTEGDKVRVAKVNDVFLSGEVKDLELDFDIVIADNYDAEWEFAGSTPKYLFFHTTRNNGEIIALDTSSCELVTILPGDGEKTLKMARALKTGNLAVVYSINVHDEIYLYSPMGQLVTSFPSSILTVLSIEPDAISDRFFILESTFYSPSSLWLTTTSRKVASIPIFPNKSLLPTFTTKQIFYKSLNKTSIPMFLTHQTCHPINPKTPVVFYIYGGFGVSVIPHFRPDFLAFILSFRGVLAIANVRGGGEKGAAWYAAAQKTKRQTLFNDVVAGVQYLKSTLRTDNIALMGESMGGLNVSAVMVQHPNLVKGVLCNVGALDVLRRNRLGLRDRGADDMGDANVPEEFDVMRTWAPLENIMKGVRYPAVLLTTGAQDDVVPALHSVKMAAALQWAGEGLEGGKDVSLIAAEESGHGFNNSAAVKIKASLNRWGWARSALGWEMFGGSLGSELGYRTYQLRPKLMCNADRIISS